MPKIRLTVSKDKDIKCATCARGSMKTEGDDCFLTCKSVTICEDAPVEVMAAKERMRKFVGNGEIRAFGIVPKEKK